MKSDTAISSPGVPSSKNNITHIRHLKTHCEIKPCRNMYYYSGALYTRKCIIFHENNVYEKNFASRTGRREVTRDCSSLADWDRCFVHILTKGGEKNR